MTINLGISLNVPTPDLRPRITVIGVGGAGGNAVNNMIRAGLEGVEFVAANTDAQALSQSAAERKVQLGVTVTQGLGAGSRPDIGRIAAEEALEELIEAMRGSNMVFIAAGMGGGTGTGGASVIARAAREQGILTVGVVTKPFHFEGAHRMRLAEQGIQELEQYVDTLIVIPNQNLFRVANDRTTFADAFKMADDVLYSGVRGVTDLMTMPGLINLDFADIRAVMSEMGKAMMGTGEAQGERRALDAAEAAISNPLLDDVSMKGARGVLINITGGHDMTLFEVDEAANRIRSEVDADAFIIFGSTFDDTMEGKIRVSVVATGMETAGATQTRPQGAAKLAVVTPMGEARGAGLGRRAEAGQDLAAATAAELPLDDAGDSNEAAAEAMQSTLLRSAQADDRPQSPFIPPAPMTRSAADTRRAEATNDSDQGKPRGKMANFFSRMTGSSATARNRNGRGDVEPLLVGDASASQKAAPRIGTAAGDDRPAPAKSEDDLLDIPAFLRRQAN
jgi:cell division protein FtsZ